MKLIKAFALGTVLVAGAAYAQERTDPNAIARSDLMKVVGKNTGVLGGMASGKEPFDAAAAEAAKVALVAAFGQVEATFMEQGGADPVDEAKPEIWSNWEDFLAKANAAATAAAPSTSPRSKPSAPAWVPSAGPARTATPATAS
jgi:cytochrome c556